MKRLCLASALLASCAAADRPAEGGPAADAPSASGALVEDDRLGRTLRAIEHAGLSARPSRALAAIGDRIEPAPSRDEGPWAGGARAPRVSIPTRSSGALRIAATPDVYVDLHPLGGERDVATRVAHGVAADLAIAEGIDQVRFVDDARFEELRVIHAPRAGVEWRWSLRRGPGVSSVAVDGDGLEVRGGAASPTLRMRTPVAIDAKGTRRALDLELRDDRLVAALDAHDLHFPLVIDPEWIQLPAPSFKKRDGYVFRTVQLASGKIMVLGGNASNVVVADVDLYDPGTGVWSTDAPMNTPRTMPVATRLGDGRVLVAGGSTGVSCTNRLSTTEIYDPNSHMWSFGPSMSTPRCNAFAAVLADGRVLIIPGPTGGGSPEILNPATMTWSPAASWGVIPDAVSGEVTGAARMTDGRVFVCDAYDGGPTTAIYDPSTNAWIQFANPFTSKGGESMCAVSALSDGRVLASQVVGVPWSGIYDPKAKSWSTVGYRMGRSLQLSTGKVVSWGWGNDADGGTLFDPSTGLGDDGAGMALPLGVGLAPGYLLPNGKALLIGHQPALLTFTAKALGTSCTRDAECESGHCADGVCCNQSCTSSCTACNESGKAGTCTPVVGAPRGSRAPCNGTDECAGTCNGVASVCSYPDGTIACGSKSCAGGQSTVPGTCDGAGACARAAPIACAPYLCDATGSQCATSCGAIGCAGGYACQAGACVPTSTPDAGSTDADADVGAADAAPGDSSAADASAVDSTTGDASTPDSALADASSADATSSDTADAASVVDSSSPPDASVTDGWLDGAVDAHAHGEGAPCGFAADACDEGFACGTDGACHAGSPSSGGCVTTGASEGERGRASIALLGVLATVARRRRGARR